MCARVCVCVCVCFQVRNYCLFFFFFFLIRLLLITIIAIATTMTITTMHWELRIEDWGLRIEDRGLRISWDAYVRKKERGKEREREREREKGERNWNNWIPPRLLLLLRSRRPRSNTSPPDPLARESFNRSQNKIMQMHQQPLSPLSLSPPFRPLRVDLHAVESV